MSLMNLWLQSRQMRHAWCESSERVIQRISGGLPRPTCRLRHQSQITTYCRLRASDCTPPILKLRTWSRRVSDMRLL